MSDDTERELQTTPLRNVSAQLLAEYTNSAHNWDDEQVAGEMRYFLPRYLELIAVGNPPDHMGGIETCLSRLAHARWLIRWPLDEVQALEEFFDALAQIYAGLLDVEKRASGWSLVFDYRDVLSLIVTAGGDVQAPLRALWYAADPGAAIHMAALRRRLELREGCYYLQSAYLERNHKIQARAVADFLLQSRVTERIEAAFFASPDVRLQAVLSRGVASLV